MTIERQQMKLKRKKIIIFHKETVSSFKKADLYPKIKTIHLEIQHEQQYQICIKNNHAGYTINSILKEIRLKVEDRIGAYENDTDEWKHWIEVFILYKNTKQCILLQSKIVYFCHKHTNKPGVHVYIVYESSCSQLYSLKFSITIINSLVTIMP